MGKTGLVTGWGTLKEDGKPSCTLQEVEVPVLSNDECTSKTNYTSKMITNNMLCAGYPGVGQRDSCQGDSGEMKLDDCKTSPQLIDLFLSHLGGPLQVERDDKRYEIIGIVSWGNGWSFLSILPCKTILNYIFLVALDLSIPAFIRELRDI